MYSTVYRYTGTDLFEVFWCQAPHQIQGVLPCGSLFQIHGPGLKDEFFFLAYALKKPKQQVLMRGFPGQELQIQDGEVAIHILHPTSNQPVFSTSGQAFQQILSELKVPSEADALSQLSFVIYKFMVNPFAPLLQVRATRSGNPHKFVVPKPAKVQTKLPFGLKAETRKRKKTVPAPPPKGPKIGNEPSKRKSDQVFLDSEPDFSARSPVASSPSSSSVSGSSSDSDSSDDDDDQAERPILSAEMAKEEAEIENVLESHQSQIERRGELFCPRGVDPDPEPTSRTAGTWCKGLMEVSLQVAAKLATCRHCVQKIQREEVRFGFSFKRNKFHSYLHSHCVTPHLQQEESDLCKDVQFLKGRLAEDDCAEIKSAIRKVIQELDV